MRYTRREIFELRRASLYDKGVKALAMLLVLSALSAHRAHESLTRIEREKPRHAREALPSIPALKLLSLGYRALVADYYFMRAISHFGDKQMHAALYPDLAAMLERVLALDPYFGAAYFLAGTALTIKGMDPGPSITLLEQGLRYRPDDWRLAFLLGFNRYYFKGDLRGGAEALAIAAKNPEAPPYTGKLAARLAAASGAPEIGLTLIDSILPSIEDEELRRDYEERRKLLELERDLKYLELARRRYLEAFGRAPKTLEELVRAEILRALPREPLGGSYYLTPSGVMTTNDARRLKLSEGAKPKVEQP